MLFEMNIKSNPSIALDNLLNLLEIDPNFIIILSNEIIKLSTIHQDKNLDKRIYDIIIKYSNENHFSPKIYEFMFNVNECESPDGYICKTKKNVFTNIFDNLYMRDNTNNNETKTNHELISLINENFLTYSCSNCGYSAKNYIWQCPSCNNWETIKPNTISDRVSIDD
jgi:lipopolysaccharide biosynthesis regulator YciM